MAGEPSVSRVEPPFWWTGFKNTRLQLMVYGPSIGSAKVTTDNSVIRVVAAEKTSNPDYLFITLDIRNARPGVFNILFHSGTGPAITRPYDLKSRKPGSASRKGFSAADVIYLITPDRFANGDTANDNLPGMAEKSDRAFKDGRHGGDIKGIMQHLDYLRDLGIGAIWINPLLENDQPKYSYHGYSTTDYYQTDPRFGSNEDYLALSDAIHSRGMKLIMDMVFNHCGSEHWWMKSLPSEDWINQWPEFTRSSYRAGTVTDPYASEKDSVVYVKGWFDKTMPDLNQKNPFLKTYLIQNSIWWIEYASLDGIRQDTHPYPFKDMMAEWGQAVLTEYPEFNTVGECWINYPATVAYWQKDACNLDGYNSWLPAVFDFPLYDALQRAFNEKEGWNTGLTRLYEILSQDFSYPDPGNLVTFADNHDVNRYFDTQGDDIRKMKMAMAFLMTTRGIPQVFYGSEILLTTGEDEGHGNLRKDFPGGWPGDNRNAFTAAGRSSAENDMYLYLKTLLNWRKTSKVIHTGKLSHFIPSDGTYTYFRYNEKETVMVVLNNSDTLKTIDAARFAEFLQPYRSGWDVTGNQPVADLSMISLPAKSALILELKK
jgi:glycosidase